MKPIKTLYLLVLGSLTLLWLLAENDLTGKTEFMALRASFINYSGIIAMSMMSIAMILAVRPALLEPLMDGLDKSYRLHKWLGITGLVLAISHWLLVNAPKWMIGWGWMERPARGPRPEQTVEIFQWFQSQRQLAESIGEWSFYAVVVLLFLALYKAFPYRYFFKTHRLVPVAYLFLVFHSLVLMDFSYWTEALGPIMALLLTLGTVSAMMSLFGRIGRKRRTNGSVTAISQHADNRVLRVDIDLSGSWPGHKAGQFAFVTFDSREGPHPFTISSPWNNDGKMFFLIKGLGDYTRALPDTLKTGDPVTIEGPYGQFDFSSERSRQIWVAGGIGITPFLARLQKMQGDRDSKAIDLFYSTALPDEHFIAKLREAAKSAGIGLHILIDAVDGKLDADQICNSVPDWQNADLWFCGPSSFGKSLRRDFSARGLPANYFHQELFAMR
ncbi:MAG: ferric reductase-like transmembrane domain-containing protein [Gammaproteobacteria bacterium]|nr:ferric reductase-like transmembrane domain-containing protein [Gammaproteobacteria bacterium]